MKYFLVMLSALAIVFGCESDKLHRKIFNDAKCTKLNTEYTEQYGKVGKKMNIKFDGKCNVYQK